MIQVTSRLARRIAFGSICVALTATNVVAADPAILRVPSSVLASDSVIEIIVFLESKPVVSGIGSLSPARALKRADRIKSVLSSLGSDLVPGRAGVESFLNSYAIAVTRHRIVPAYTVRIPSNRANALALLPGVRVIVPNAKLELVEPTEFLAASSSSGISSGLSALNVSSLWQAGLTGKGRLVCSFDTGVEESHPALSSKWRGRHAPLSASWFSTLTPDSPPVDRVNHGTHTMGVMVGSDGVDTVGVAPGAEWITAGVIDQGRNLNSTLSDILLAFEWVLNPDGDTATTDDVPDVILNSWGIPAGLFAACDSTFWGVIDKVEAAGIVTVFAAGNEGPNPQTIRNPADRPTGPTNSFSVGAVSDDGVVADFSSRGPSTCDPSRVKPEIVAPGVRVRSSVKGGGYGLMSGSSMAAPYIAGLVALLRQFNPDATVAEIKTAFIMAAQDLGEVGPDNSYGHGLVDASRLLEFLPAPSNALFSIGGAIVSGGGLALPGETVSLSVYLSNAASNTPLVFGRLRASDSTKAVVSADGAMFLFGNGGSTALGSSPFTITLANDLIHGENLDFWLFLEDSDGTRLDSLPINFDVGYSPPGDFRSHNAGRVRFSVSDFGQFGFAPSTAYNLAGDGFSIDGGDNLLYEAGIVVARSPLQFSSGFRDMNGQFAQSDFAPVNTISEKTDFNYGGKNITATYTDSGSDIPIPVIVRQQTVDYADIDGSGIILMRFSIINSSLAPVTGINFGFFADFDLGAQETITVDNESGMLIQKSARSEMVGVVPLENIASLKTLANQNGKTGFTPEQTFDLISTPTSSVTAFPDSDMMFLITAGPFNLFAGDSADIAFAIVVGYSEADLYRSAAIAEARFSVITAVEDNRELLPGEFVLGQNYPNPFNPSTNIAFSLSAGAEVRFEVFNILGQVIVSRDLGKQPAGDHILTWDGKNGQGETVASGVYFYRVVAGSQVQTRKMMLLR